MQPVRYPEAAVYQGIAPRLRLRSVRRGIRVQRRCVRASDRGGAGENTVRSHIKSCRRIVCTVGNSPQNCVCGRESAASPVRGESVTASLA